ASTWWSRTAGSRSDPSGGGSRRPRSSTGSRIRASTPTAPPASAETGRPRPGRCRLPGRLRQPECPGSARRASFGSEAQRRLQPGRGLLPRVALAAEVVAVVEEGSHEAGVEILLLVLEPEVGTDVGEVEVEPVALRRRVDPVEIADALRVEE